MTDGDKVATQNHVEERHTIANTIRKLILLPIRNLFLKNLTKSIKKHNFMINKAHKACRDESGLRRHIARVVKSNPMKAVTFRTPQKGELLSGLCIITFLIMLTNVTKI